LNYTRILSFLAGFRMPA